MTISWKSVHQRFRGIPIKGVRTLGGEPYPGILTRNTSKTRHTRVHLRLDYPLDQHAYTLFMPCKGCVFDTRGPRWKSKRASHSRGPVINVRVNSRLVRDRKVAGYSRYGSPQKRIIKSVFGVTTREREREARHSPFYFANSNFFARYIVEHKFRPIEKFNIVETFVSRNGEKLIEQVENSAKKKIRGRRRCTISRRGIEQLGGMVDGLARYETVARQKIGRSPNTIGFCRDKKRSDEPADISIRFTGATTGRAVVPVRCLTLAMRGCHNRPSALIIINYLFAFPNDP